MENKTGNCEHRWRYFVHLESRAVRMRECERCGSRGVIPTYLEPLHKLAPAMKEALSA